MDVSRLKLEVPTRFLNDETLERLFVFSKDEKIDEGIILANTLSRPQLIEYYLEAANEWR